MLTHKSQLLFIAVIAILLSTVFSFPYSIYDIRRTLRANGNVPPISGSRQHYDQPSYRPLSQYNSNYDTLYDTGADNYYVDDDDVDDSNDRPEREYLYGKPTYRGEYKPTRYYYARAPNYNYYNDHVESTNPLDDLHEEMLQEDHNRQRNIPSSVNAQWMQSSGQPKSLTNNIMKNLMRNVNTPKNDMNIAYDNDGDTLNPYFDDDLSKQNAEPNDYFDPLKYQTNPFNHYDSSTSFNKQNYYNHENHGNHGNHNDNKNSMTNKKYQTNNYKHDSSGDEDEKELESLRDNYKNAWNINDHNDNVDYDDDNGAKQSTNVGKSSLKNKQSDIYTGNYDSGFNYDEDEWINWNRKRSLPKQQLRPLKALEYELTKAIQQQSDTSDALKLSTTTVPSTTTTTTR